MKCVDEVYLSGYLDGELPVEQVEQIEAHLDTCSSCRSLLEQLRGVRLETSTMNYLEPSTGDWRRVEKSIYAMISRGLGWIVLVAWSVVTTVYTCYEYFSTPGEPLFRKVLVFAFFLGLGLLFLSVLSERIRDSKTDRYKGVRQ
jgi:hypothetical protein